jgi:hypothetical protein
MRHDGKFAPILVLAGLLGACSQQDRLVGNGSETTTGVSVRVLGANDRPVPGALVQARPSQWIPDSAGRFDPVRSAATDSNGVAHLARLPAGSWSLVASGRDGKALGILYGGGSDSIDLPLRPTTSVHGRVDSTVCSSARVAISGVGRSVRTGASGAFDIDSLPAGSLVLRVASDSGPDRRATRTVLAASGVAADAGTIVPTAMVSASGWTDSIRIDVDLGGTRTDTLFGYPLLVRLADTSLDFSKTNGTDLRFARGSNALAHEVAQWDPLSRTGDVWVRLDTILPTDRTVSLVLRYGGIDMPDWSSSTRVFPSSEGWIGAWHLEAADPGAEASANRRAMNFRTLDASGVSGRGRFCDTGWLRVPDDVGLHPQTLTLSCWSKRSGAQISVGKLLSKGNFDDWHDTWALQEFDPTWKVGFLSLRRDSVSDTLRSKAAPADGVWCFIAATWDQTTGRQVLYMNGAAIDSSVDTRLLDYENRLPSDLDLFLGANFIGTIDEPRISSMARSASWIALDQRIQNPKSTAIHTAKLP